MAVMTLNSCNVNSTKQAKISSHYTPLYKKVLTLFRDTSCFVFSHYCLFFFFSCVNNVKQSCQIYLPWFNSYSIAKSLVDTVLPSYRQGVTPIV